MLIVRGGRWRVPHPPPLGNGIVRVDHMKILGVPIRSDPKMTTHVDEILTACTWSLYPHRIFRAHGLSGDLLFQVTRATTINWFLYAGPACWGLTSAQGRERIERFCRKLERAGCVAEDRVDIDLLMEGADKGLLMAVVRNAEHVLRPHFPPVISRRSNLSPRTHNFRLPDKADSNFIPKVLHRFSRTIQQSWRLSILYCTMLRFVIMVSLNEDTYT